MAVSLAERLEEGPEGVSTVRTQEDVLNELMALRPQLIGYVTNLVKDSALAEDLMSQLIEKYVKKPELCASVQSRRFYYVALKNLSLNHLRDSKRRLNLVNGFDPEKLHPVSPTDPLLSAGISQTRALVDAALGTLTPDHAEILDLRIKQDFSYLEIAEHLGIPIGTVMSRLCRARKRFLEALNDQGAVDPAVLEAI